MSKISVSNVDYKSIKKEITRIYGIVNNSKKQLSDARSYLLYYSPEVHSMYSSEFTSALSEYNNILEKIGRIERYIQTVDDSLSDTESELRKLIGSFGSTIKGALSPVKKATSTTIKKAASKNLIFSKILKNISKVTNNGSKKIKLVTSNFSNALKELKLVYSNTKELSANSYFNPISEKNILDYLRNNNDDFITEFKKTDYGKVAFENINNDNYVLNVFYKYLGIDKKYGEASYKIWIMNNAAELSNYSEEDLWTIYCSSKMNTKVQYSQLEKDYANSAKDFKNYESQIINMLRNDTSGTFDDIKTSMIFKKKNSFDLISGGALKTDVNSEISKLSDEELIKLFYKYLDADKKNFKPDLRDSSGNKLTGDKYYIALEQAWIKHCDNLIQHKMYDKMVRKEKAKAQKEFDELPFLQKALSTAAVGGEKLVSGIMQAGEELADGVYVGEGFLVKHIGNFITGDDKWGEHVDKVVQRNVGTESVGFLEDSLYDSDFGKYLNKTSYIDKDGQVAGVLNTIGNMAGKITLTSAFSGGLAKSGFAQAKGLSSAMSSGGDTIYKLTKSGEVASKFVSAGYFFTSEVGSGFEKATIEGANYSDAFSYSMVNGVVNGAADFALGQAFESGSFKDILTSAGSGFVEPFITSTAKHEIYAQDKSLLDVFEEDGTLNNAVMGAAMGAIMPGLGGKFSNILDTSVFFKDAGGVTKIKNNVEVDIKNKTKVSDVKELKKNSELTSKKSDIPNKKSKTVSSVDTILKNKVDVYSNLDNALNKKIKLQNVATTPAWTLPALVDRFIYRKLNPSITTSCLNDGLYHLTSYDSAKKIIDSGYVKSSDMITSYGRKKAFFFNGVPSIENVALNLSDMPTKIAAVKIDPSLDDLSNMKYRPYDKAIVSYGNYNLKDNAEIKFLCLVEENGNLKYKEVSKDFYDNYDAKIKNSKLKSTLLTLSEFNTNYTKSIKETGAKISDRISSTIANRKALKLMKETGAHISKVEVVDATKFNEKNGYQIDINDMDDFYKAKLKQGFFTEEQITGMLKSVNEKGFISKNTADYITKLFNNSDYDIYIKTVHSTDVDSMLNEGIYCNGTSTSVGGGVPKNIGDIDLNNTISKVNSIYDLVATLKNASGVSQGGNPIDGTEIIKIPKNASMDDIVYFNNEKNIFCIKPDLIDGFFKVDGNGNVSDIKTSLNKTNNFDKINAESKKSGNEVFSSNAKRNIESSNKLSSTAKKYFKNFTSIDEALKYYEFLLEISKTNDYIDYKKQHDSGNAFGNFNPGENFKYYANLELELNLLSEILGSTNDLNIKSQYEKLKHDKNVDDWYEVKTDKSDSLFDELQNQGNSYGQAQGSIEKLYFYEDQFGRQYSEYGMKQLQKLNDEVGKISPSEVSQYLNNKYVTNPELSDLLDIYIYAYNNNLHLDIKKLGTNEYFKLKNKLSQKGFSASDSSMILSGLDKTGACSYAAPINQMISIFQHNQEYFESIFGYKLFIKENGKIIVNSDELLLDLYIFANDVDNGGKLFKKNRYTGDMEVINKDFNNLDVFGRLTLDSEYQTYLNSTLKKNSTILDAFLKSKDPSLNWNTYRLVQKENTNMLSVSELNKVVRDAEMYLKTDGCEIELDIFTLMSKQEIDNPIRMIEIGGSQEVVTTNTWGEGGGHAMYVTGTTNKGFVVSSWGKKYLIPFEDLQRGIFTMNVDWITQRR